jgi:hypothetical protein
MESFKEVYAVLLTRFFSFFLFQIDKKRTSCNEEQRFCSACQKFLENNSFLNVQFHDRILISVNYVLFFFLVVEM